MQVLVTGASGFIGRALTRRLVERGHDVTAMGCRAVDAGVPGAVWIRGDLAVADALEAAPTRIDAVAHLAQSPMHREFPDRAREIAAVNIGGTVAVLDYARRAGAATFLLASSGNVYGPAPGPLDESAALAPGDFYGATKVAAETLTTAYRSQFRTTIVRLFGVYGAGQPPDRLLPRLVAGVRSEEAMVVDPRGGLGLNPIHRDDVVEAMTRLLEEGGPDCLNVGGPDVVTIRSIAEAIAVELGVRLRVREVPGDGPAHLIADIGRLRAALPPLPRVRFLDGLRELLAPVAEARH